MEESPIFQNASTVLVRKNREQEHDQKIIGLCREARRRFILEQITNALNKAKADKNTINEILQLFLNSQGTIDVAYLGYLKKYRSQIQQLNQRFLEIQSQFAKRERECLPITQIVQQKIISLKTIHIQYQRIPKFQDKEQCPYSLSAFDLFKLVNQNKLLTEVILTGIFIQQFQLFIQWLTALQRYEIEESEREEFEWMKSFCPSKGLRMSFSTKLQFDVLQKEETLFKIRNLMFFEGLFEWLSDISVKIQLGYFGKNIKKWAATFSDLCDCLRRVKKINIQLERYGMFTPNQICLFRSTVFGGLATFTEIAGLQFKGVGFTKNISHNDFLALEQALCSIFENNSITHFKLYNCAYFPMIPKIGNVRSIDLSCSSFCKELDLANRLAQSKLTLRYIKCSDIQQEWRIDEELLSQLQALIIKGCDRISLDDMSPKPLFNLKHLSLTGLNLDNLDQLFPKLSNVEYLYLNYINLRHQVLCTFSSAYLKDLIFFDCDSLTDRGLQEIDSKCPSLRNLKLYGCSNVTQRVWSVCRFAGLKEVTVDEEVFYNTQEILQELKRRGIKVSCW